MRNLEITQLRFIVKAHWIKYRIIDIQLRSRSMKRSSEVKFSKLKNSNFALNNVVEVIYKDYCNLWHWTMSLLIIYFHYYIVDRWFYSMNAIQDDIRIYFFPYIFFGDSGWILSNDLRSFLYRMFNIERLRKTKYKILVKNLDNFILKSI